MHLGTGVGPSTGAGLGNLSGAESLKKMGLSLSQQPPVAKQLLSEEWYFISPDPICVVIWVGLILYPSCLEV